MFIVFRGAEFYPSGGWSDYLPGAYKYHEDTKRAALENIGRNDWWQIVEFNDFADTFDERIIGIVETGVGP